MMRAFVCATFAALLAGCGAGGGTTSAAGSFRTTPLATANVSFSISVPRTTAASARRSPAYVSSGTASMSVTVGGATTSAPCTAPATTCTVQLAAPIGSDTFTASLYDGSMNQLASGSVTMTITANILNTINLTFDGIVHSLTATFDNPTITLGAPASSVLTIVAKDAAGSIIVPPGDYTLPVVVTESPTLPASLTLTGATTITTIPASSSTVTVNYDGTAVGTSSILFTVTSGTVSGTAALTFPTVSGLHVNHATLQFTTIPASAQTETISENNYAGTWSDSGACGSIASVSAVSGSTITVAPLAVGTCTESVHDTLGNSTSFTIDVATTAITGS